jgi:hypothetical protein
VRRHEFVAAALGAAALLLLAAAAFAAGRPSLECYFQTTLHDPVYQKKTYEKVAAKWKTPAAPDVPAVGK